ncbi:MAG: DNA replication/repair protein RecF [Coriobacteriia bacterium]|nr:DNA replication/repair protein RecF [Coriobacteriia bacterium]
MGFTVTRLLVKDFRNYEDYGLTIDSQLTVLVGPNAVGKTNLVEALEMLTEADSFRRPAWADLVRIGAPEAKLTLEAAEGERHHTVELTITAGGRRLYRVNGKAKKSVSDVSGIIPCVVFTPEDLKIVKDSAERRRAALDGIGGQLSKTYGRLRLEYERVVRQRNALLRQDDTSDDLLAPWDERLVSLGSRLVIHRRRLFDRIMEEAVEVYGDIAGDGPLEAWYVPSWDRDGTAVSDEDEAASMERHLAAKKDDERTRRTTLTGPHRDEIVFHINGKDARAFASQGQQRSIALAFKLAEVAVVAEVAGAKPILLLDDVMSELDEGRRHALASLVGEAAQTVISTTNLGYFSEELIARAKVVELP